MNFIGLSATLLSILIVSLSVQPAFASTVEAELRMPWEELNKELPLQKSQFDWGETALQFQDLPFLFKSIRLEMQSQAQEIMHFNTNPFHTQIKISGLQLKLSTGPFLVRHDILREVNGAQVVVRLSAECSGVELQQSGVQVLSRFDWEYEDRNAASRISTFDVGWPATGWQISGIQCQGPTGFGEIMQQELQKIFAHPEHMFPLLKEKLQTYVNVKISDLTRNVLSMNFKFMDDRTQIKIERIKSIDIRGVILALRINLQDDDPQNFPFARQSYAAGPRVDLSVSSKGLEKILQFASKGQVFQSTDDQLSGFKQLMRSRFMQFFLWPDLMNFPKHTAFKFIHKLNDDSKIELSKGLIKLSIKGDSWLQGERDQKMWDYVFFRTQFNAQSKLSIVDSKLSVSLDGNDLRINKQFGTDYKARYRPSERIATSIIQTAIRETYLKRQLNWELPSFEIHPGIQFKVQNMQLDGEANYSFEFQKK